MILEQEKVFFKPIRIILATPEEALKFIELMEYATNHAVRNELDFELGIKICNYFSERAVIPSD